MGKKMKTILTVLIILALAVLVSGCIGQSSTGGTTIKSEAEASQKITNISDDIDKVASTLEDIDSKLG